MISHEDVLRLIRLVDQNTDADALLHNVLAIGMSVPQIREIAETYKISYPMAARVCVVQHQYNDSFGPQTALIDPQWDEQHVIAIKYKKSGSGNMTWRCTLESGDELYIRQSNKQRWLDAGYTQLETMKEWDEWDADITCYTMPGDKNFLDCQHVVPGGTLAAPAVDTDRLRRAEAVRAAKDWVYGIENYYFLDTETTGKGADDEVIEIAIVDSWANCILDTRVRPSCPISAEARAVHGIIRADLVDAPVITDITVDGMPLRDWLQTHKLVSYGGEFDEDRIQQSYRAAGEPLDGFTIGCAMKLYAKFNGEKHAKTGDWKYVSLAEACAKMRVADEPNHSALTDALAAHSLLLALADYEEAEEDTPF